VGEEERCHHLDNSKDLKQLVGSGQLCLGRSGAKALCPDGEQLPAE